ncbi:hypothetical protein D5086_018695 [Populus alba]|uniref:Uncharacterized protein n=1 Tax=Populus alba TaxID=43335 RepID=A0ACC4BR50_POPAL
MASSSNQKTGFHARSNSFPSRLNPVITQLDEHLSRSRASEGACTSSSLGGKLSSLQDLHDCVNKRGCVETGLTSEVKKYLTSRKVAKRAIHKALKVIKKNCSFTAFNGDRENTIMFNMLKEVEVVSLKAFDSLLSFISGPEARTTGWSLVSKLVHHKKVASADEEADINEFSKADAALSALGESGIIQQSYPVTTCSSYRYATTLARDTEATGVDLVSLFTDRDFRT